MITLINFNSKAKDYVLFPQDLVQARELWFMRKFLSPYRGKEIALRFEQYHEETSMTQKMSPDGNLLIRSSRIGILLENVSIFQKSKIFITYQLFKNFKFSILHKSPCVSITIQENQLD